MDGSLILIGLAGLIAVIVLGRAKANTQPTPISTPAARADNPTGGPILDAVLQILKQLGEQKPITGIQTKVIHPTHNITISLTKEDTHASGSSQVG